MVRNDEAIEALRRVDQIMQPKDRDYSSLCLISQILAYKASQASSPNEVADLAGQSLLEAQRALAAMNSNHYMYRECQLLVAKSLINQVRLTKVTPDNPVHQSNLKEAWALSNEVAMNARSDMKLHAEAQQVLNLLS